MIVGDVIRLVAISTVGVLSLADDLTIPLLVGLVAVYGVGQALFGPAFSSIVPSIVPEDLLVEANSLGQFVRPIAMTLVGPLVGGFLVGSVGAGWAFIADGGTFAFSALMILLMRVRRAEREPEHEASIWAEAKEGIRYVRQQTWLWVGHGRRRSSACSASGGRGRRSSRSWSRTTWTGRRPTSVWCSARAAWRPSSRRS